LATVSIDNFEVIQTTGPTEGPRSSNAPTVVAGSNQVIEIDGAANLSAIVTAPNGGATITWRLYSGPASVQLTNPNNATASASFTGFGIAGALNDPMLDLRDGAGNQIAANDNWKDSQEQAIADSGFAPANDSEAAIASTLAPGNYTAIVSGKSNTTGISLVEV